MSQQGSHPIVWMQLKSPQISAQNESRRGCIIKIIPVGGWLLQGVFDPSTALAS